MLNSWNFYWQWRRPDLKTGWWYVQFGSSDHSAVVDRSLWFPSWTSSIQYSPEPAVYTILSSVSSIQATGHANCLGRLCAHSVWFWTEPCILSLLGENQNLCVLEGGIKFMVGADCDCNGSLDLSSDHTSPPHFTWGWRTKQQLQVS